MDGPWTQYAPATSDAAPPTGPWSQYAAQAKPEAAPDNPAMTEFPTYAAPSSGPAPGDAAVERIGGAASTAFQQTPEVLAPAAREALDKYGGTGPFGAGEFANRVAHGATNVLGAANAGMAALSQTAMELFGEKGGRDLLAFASSLPMAPEAAQLTAMRANTPDALAKVPAASEPSGAPQFVSERYAPDVSQMDPRNAIQALITHDINENPTVPGMALDRGTANQSLAKIGGATNIDEAITAAGDAAQAPVDRPIARWMLPLSKEEPALTGEVLPPEPSTATPPQSMADYLKANAVSAPGIDLTPASAPDVHAVTASIDAGDVVNTSKAAKQIASYFYKVADEAGDQLPAEVTAKTIDYGRKLADEEPMVSAARGAPHPLADMMDRLEQYRDEPMSLQAQQGFDQLLGDKIDGQYQNGRLSGEGKELLDLQTYLRGLVQDEIDNPSGAGLPGFEAKIAANKAWQAAMQLDDLERIQERASRTENPATSIKTQINALLSNRARSRGYTDAERAALETAATRGVLAGALNIIGSRLVPIALGTHGALTLNPVTMAAGGLGMAASAAARRGVAAIQNSRLQNAMNVIGSKVPAAPPAQPVP